MFIYDLIDFLKQYSQDTIIVAILVSICSAIIDKFLTIKQKTYIKIFTPFILGIIFYFLYDVIVYHTLNFTFEVAYAGILCGSLSSGIFAFIDRLLNGKTLKVDRNILIIEGKLNGFVNKEFITKTAENILTLLNENNDKDKTIIEIKNVIIENKIEDIDNDSIYLLASMIYESVKNSNLY